MAACAIRYPKADADRYLIRGNLRRQQETLSYSIYLPCQSITVTFLFMWILQLLMGDRPRVEFLFSWSGAERKENKIRVKKLN